MAIDSSENSIINSALVKLGVRRLTAAQLQTAADNKASRLAWETYENFRDDLVQDHPWNFATFRADLDKNVTVPEFDYSYSYDLPNGTTPASKPVCLRVLFVKENPVWEWRESGWFLHNEPQGEKEWKVEGGTILTNHDEPLSIRYIGQITDGADMTPMFKDLLSSMLAVEWCESLTSADGLADRLESRFARKLIESRTIDGQEGIPDSLESSFWLSGRMT